MKKINYYKKSLHNFGIFLLLLFVLGVMIIPCYSSFMTSVKEETVKNFDGKIRQEIKMEENEINLQVNVLKNVSNTREFKMLANPPAYGYDKDSVEWFESRENVQKSYSVLKSIVSIQDKSFMLFRNSDLLMDTNGSIDDFRASYDTLWRFTTEGGKCSMDFASLQMFHKKHDGHFVENLAYSDISTGKTYELIYLLTLSNEEEEVCDSIFVACYDAEKFVERLGFKGDVTSILITNENGKKLYGYGKEYDLSVYDSCYKSENLNLNVYYSISDECLQRQMSGINLFLFMTMFILIVFGLIVTVGISVIERRHITNLLAVVDGTTDIEYSEEDDHIKYLETVLKKMYSENKKNNDALKMLIYSKLLNFKLSESEKKVVYDDFASPVFVLLLKNTGSEQGSAGKFSVSFLKEKGADITHYLNINSTDFVIFAKMSNVLRNIVDDMIVAVNKNYKADMKGVSAVCNDVNEVPVIFEKMKKTVQYIEYGYVKFIKDFEKDSDNEDFVGILSKNRQLYEIIRSGNDFEAKRIVYEQWYKITQGEFNASCIEPLFFSQISVLSQILAEYKLNVAVPKYDSEKDAVAIAFEITECIEMLCEKMKGGDTKKEDVRVSQIIEYIGQRYCDSAFYMPELVGKFELSDRAIVQMLKKATGDNFSNYLSKLRIAKAQELLSTTGIAVSEVASASGFDSANSLYKAFKKVYGVSPSTYRENRKKDSIQS